MPANQLTTPQVAGYDADTGELVAKALGVEPCFVTPSWTEITAGKWSDRWDIAFGSGAITADRMTRLWMTAPYRTSVTRATSSPAGARTSRTRSRDSHAVPPRPAHRGHERP